jgi:5-methylcytosine-specific restriction endonuclease McrA
MTHDSFNRSPAVHRAMVAWGLAGRAAHVLKRLDDPCPSYPKLDVLPEDHARVVAAYDRRCVYCGADAGDGVAIDLIVPERRGGTTQPDNLVAACERCKVARRGRHLDAFLVRRLDLDRRSVYARIARATASLRAAATRDRSGA